MHCSLEQEAAAADGISREGLEPKKGSKNFRSRPFRRRRRRRRRLLENGSNFGIGKKTSAAAAALAPCSLND